MINILSSKYRMSKEASYRALVRMILSPENWSSTGSPASPSDSRTHPPRPGAEEGPWAPCNCV